MPHYLLQFFDPAHLPADLQPVAEAFADLARGIDATLPDNPEHSACLRKLLEARDCSLRALHFQAPPPASGAFTATLNETGSADDRTR